MDGRNRPDAFGRLQIGKAKIDRQRAFGGLGHDKTGGFKDLEDMIRSESPLKYESLGESLSSVACEKSPKTTLKTPDNKKPAFRAGFPCALGCS